MVSPSIAPPLEDPLVQTAALIEAVLKERSDAFQAP